MLAERMEGKILVIYPAYALVCVCVVEQKRWVNLSQRSPGLKLGSFILMPDFKAG